ncbi:restriction endonuclease subunit S [Acinetobacter pittii]|uniref:restriction endonuclease subunit S n=1 Tax=Acinetobacter pittii TaxID=48296 RepID=UPI0021CDCCCB|nr:restriction endonuclease subunit S [Acinetobacter pittii]MCU4708399.1 restriction endonuclease subunit S [Acinetobacter pittii]
MTDVKKLITENLDIWLTAETEKKSGRGRSSGSNDSIYGVKKLRELILDLAVHGKLISQVESKLDVRKLVETHIQDQKLNIKKPFIIDKTNLPLHWVRVHLATIADHNTGKTLDKNRNTGSSRSYITTSNLYWGRFELDDLKEFLIEDSELERCQARKGDLLVIEGGDAGRSAIWWDDEPICFQNHIHRVRPFSGIISEYLYRCFEQFYLSGEIENYRQGVGIKSLSGKRLAQIPINLPPLEEQKRIVAKVDELMQLCDQLEQQQNLSSEAHDQLVDTFLNVLINSSDIDEFQQNWQRISENFGLLFTTEYSIEKLKQTILQLAVMGKLVKQDPNDEDVNFLLKRIEINKNERVKSKEIQKPKVISVEQSLKFDIPQNWKKVLLNDIAFVTKLAGFEYTKYMKLADSGEVPVIRAQNVKPFELNENSLKYIDLETSQLLQRCALDRKALLMTFIGAGIGDVCVFNKEQRYHLAPNVAKIEPFADTNINYLLIFLNGIWGKDEIFKSLKATAQPSISMTTIREIWLPLPPLTEQNRIVEKVNELFSIIDKLQTLQSKLQKTKLHLADTLVTNALSDSNDKSKFEVADNIVQFEKPIEIVKQSKQKSVEQIDLFTDDIVEDDIKLLSLAAEITFQLHTEPTFGHLKLQKLVYLCQQLKYMDLAADFKQHAAGPYDPVMARYLDKEFKNREWFSYDPKRDLKYKPLSRCNDHRSAFNRYFAEDVSEIYDLIGLFRTSKSDHIEIVATLFACWLRLLEKKLSVTEEQLLKDFYAWSEEKKRFSKAEVLTGYKWMHQYSVIPQL